MLRSILKARTPRLESFNAGKDAEVSMQNLQIGSQNTQNLTIMKMNLST